MRSVATLFRGVHRATFLGELSLADGRLRFVALHKRNYLQQRTVEPICLFDEPTHGLRYRFPRYYFGAAFKVYPNERRPLTFGLVKPVEGGAIIDELLIGIRMSGIVAFFDIREGVKLGKQWRTELVERGAVADD